MQKNQFLTNFVLFIFACVALGLSIWALATPCKKDTFKNQELKDDIPDPPLSLVIKPFKNSITTTTNAQGMMIKANVPHKVLNELQTILQGNQECLNCYQFNSNKNLLNFLKSNESDIFYEASFSVDNNLLKSLNRKPLPKNTIIFATDIGWVSNLSCDVLSRLQDNDLIKCQSPD